MGNRGKVVQEVGIAWTVTMRWQQLDVFGEWPVARMEEYGAKKLAWGQIVCQIKEFGFYPVSRGSMTT